MTAKRSPRGWGALALPREADDGNAPALGPWTGAGAFSAAQPHGPRPDPGLAVVVLARLRSGDVPWAVGQLVRGGLAWQAEPGLRFVRVLGSGRGGGFGLRPGLDHQGVFMMFDDVDDAMRCVWRSPRVATYRDRAEQCLVAVLQASSARGRWGGQAMRAIATSPGPGEPLVALTSALSLIHI